MAQAPYNSMVWRNIRLRVLARDGYLCQIRLPGCHVRANTVDHIVELADGGAVYAMSNLQAACTPCNTSKSRAAKWHGRALRAPGEEADRLSTGSSPASSTPVDARVASTYRSTWWAV
jgi:5-methylcytosine-specific restriction endonuclease McrA